MSNFFVWKFKLDNANLREHHISFEIYLETYGPSIPESMKIIFIESLMWNQIIYFLPGQLKMFQ